jgi:DNA-binding transcriptional LysR family regulator
VAEETLRRLQLGRDEVRAIAKASSETLRFASTHVLSLTFFPLWLRQLENAHPFSATVELTADNMVACERLMVEGRAQFLLCHHHEAATTRFGSDFRSIRLGEDVLLPVATPGLLSDESAGALPQLCFTADSGMGRILSAAWAAAGREPPSNPIFTSHLASVLTAMARDGRASPGPRKVWSRTIWQAAGWYAPAPDDDVPIEIRLWRPKARQSAAAEALWSRILKAHSSPAERAAAPETGAITLAVQKRALMPA